jgi:type-F conjugative transfer system pilin assembly thiol-disulfide isomerase TrbB
MAYRIIILLLLLAFPLLVSAQEPNWMKQLIESKEQNSKIEKKGNEEDEFFTDHGLILFYASTCPHCHEFAPILKTWSESHQAKVLAFSFDNRQLPQFPHFLPATPDLINAAFKGQVIEYPALFVINHKTKNLYPVGFGSMNFDELDSRTRILIPEILIYEKRGMA